MQHALPAGIHSRQPGTGAVLHLFLHRSFQEGICPGTFPCIFPVQKVLHEVSRRGNKERTGHPAQFPLQIIERIVRASSNQLEIVLDPFAGSCSTGIAAVALGRISLGIEISLDYCKLAVERYENFKKEKDNANRQMELF